MNIFKAKLNRLTILNQGWAIFFGPRAISKKFRGFLTKKNSKSDFNKENIKLVLN